MEQGKRYTLRLENHKLRVQYRGDWELDGIRNNFETTYSEFNTASLYQKAAPKYIQKVYKFYNTHNKTEKELEFNEGWAFYFATKLKDQIENINELEKLKNE